MIGFLVFLYDWSLIWIYSSFIFALFHLLTNGYEILFILMSLSIFQMFCYLGVFSPPVNCSHVLSIFLFECLFVIIDLQKLLIILPTNSLSVRCDTNSISQLAAYHFFKQLYWDIVCIPYSSSISFIHKVMHLSLQSNVRTFSSPQKKLHTH